MRQCNVKTVRNESQRKDCQSLSFVRDNVQFCPLSEIITLYKVSPLSLSIVSYLRLSHLSLEAADTYRDAAPLGREIL